MKKLFYLIASGMAGFMDFAVGCLIAVVVALFLNHPIEWWEPIVAGAVFSLLPDYDIVWSILKTTVTGKSLVPKHHESLMHWPALVISIVPVLVAIVFGPYWGFTALLCIAGHYAHDAYMMGRDGFPWFIRLKPGFWNPEEGGEPVDPDHSRWIRMNWLRISKIGMTEVFIGAVAIALAIALAGSRVSMVWALVGFSTFVVVCVGAMLFWAVSEMFNYDR